MHSDGKVKCHRQDFDGATESSDGSGIYWIGYPDGRRTDATAITVEADAGPQAAPLDQLHRIYSELIDQTLLSSAHQKLMMARGFTGEEVRTLKVRTLDQVARKFASRAAEMFPFWQQTPGFYVKGGRPALGGMSGIIIPCPDLHGKIQALRIRLDNPRNPKEKYNWMTSKSHGGPGPGSPLSWYPAEGGPKVIRITEGELKAAYATLRTGISTIACPGVSFFDRVMEWLAELGAEMVILSPDSDFRTNRHVCHAMRVAIATIGAVYPITIEIWDPTEKGVDDAIKAGLTIRSITTKEFLAMIEPEPKPSKARAPRSNEVLARIGATDHDVLKELKAKLPGRNKQNQIFWNDQIKSICCFVDDFASWYPVLKPPALANALEDKAGIQFWRETINDEGPCVKRVSPSKPVMERFLALDGSDQPLRKITEFTSHPTMAPNGRLILEPGLHESGVYYRPLVKLDPIPDAPPKEAVAYAVEFIDQLLAGFPFDGMESIQAWWAYLLTPILGGFAPRPVPLFHFSSNVPGSGKGKLAAIPGMILGMTPAFQSLDEKDSEVRKMLTSHVSEGNCPYLILDNVKGRVDSPSIEAFLTTPVWTDRYLGTNKTFRGEIKTSLAITGNNLTMSKDLERRQILIRLASKTPEPHLRTDFKIPDLEQFINENREHLTWCIVLIVQNWIAKGMPKSPHRMGSFERWSEAIGGVLAAAGIGCEFMDKTRTAVAGEVDSWTQFANNWVESTLALDRQPTHELIRFTRDTGIILKEPGTAASLGRQLSKKSDCPFRIGTKVYVLKALPFPNRTLWSLVKISEPTPADPDGKAPLEGLHDAGSDNQAVFEGLKGLHFSREGLSEPYAIRPFEGIEGFLPLSPLMRENMPCATHHHEQHEQPSSCAMDRKTLNTLKNPDAEGIPQTLTTKVQTLNTLKNPDGKAILIQQTLKNPDGKGIEEGFGVGQSCLACNAPLPPGRKYQCRSCAESPTPRIHSEPIERLAEIQTQEAAAEVDRGIEIAGLDAEIGYL